VAYQLDCLCSRTCVIEDVRPISQIYIVFLEGSVMVQRVLLTPKTLDYAAYVQVCISGIDPPEGHQSQSSRYAAHLRLNICSKSSVLDTSGAALSVLPLMGDRGSACSAVMLNSAQHNAKNPPCIDLCISS
jgi:hypothetical protein